MNFILSVLGASFSLLGNVMLIFKKRYSFLIWTIGNIAWISYALSGEKNLPLIAMNGAYIVINLAAYWRWGINPKQRR